MFDVSWWHHELRKVLDVPVLFVWLTPTRLPAQMGLPGLKYEIPFGRRWEYIPNTSITRVTMALPSIWLQAPTTKDPLGNKAKDVRCGLTYSKRSIWDQRWPQVDIWTLGTMKFIDDSELSKLAQSLTHEGPECSVRTRIEAYSCKNIKRDKKLFRSLEDAYNDEVSHSPPVPSFQFEREATTFGPFDQQASRKTLYLLIATLNVAFPDHRFADVRPGHFNREKNGASVLNALSTTLIAPHRAGISAPRTYSFYPPTSADLFQPSVPTSSSPSDTWKPSPYAAPQIISGTHPSIYRVLDERIGLAECEVYSYVPDIDADPHAGSFDDDDDDTGSIGDSESSSDPDDSATFEFDDYDVDELPRPGSSPPKPSYLSPPSGFSSRDDDAGAGGIFHMRRRGALLWSSHWFFFNRKMNRILFITVWARTRGAVSGGAWEDEQVSMKSSERFFAWEGGEGAGARAMGITPSS